MSSSPLFVLMALTSFLLLPGGAVQAVQGNSVEVLLLRDEFQKAEILLRGQPRTAGNIALGGEVEYRKGNFDMAEALYTEALKMDGNTARAHFGLGKLAMTKLRGQDAVQAIARAIEVDPKEPLYRLYASEAWAILRNYREQRAQLQEYLRLSPADASDRIAEAKAGLEVLKAFQSEDIGKVEGTDSPAPIRFRKSLNLIFMNVTINGQGPYDFVIDTGASQTVLSEKLTEELGLKPITSTVMHGVGGVGKIDTKIYRLNEIEIGEVKIKNVPAGTFNDPLVTQLADGILGTALLSDFVVTLNYPANQMELTRQRPPVAGNDSEVLPARFFSNLLLVPIQVNSEHRGYFVVDTGAVTTVISHSMASSIGVNESTPGAKVDLALSGVGGFEGVVLRVPNVTFNTPKNSEVYPQVVSIDLKQISRMIGTEVSGVIGFDFFEKATLTLDYSRAEVILSR